jgi:hypothetical protein
VCVSVFDVAKERENSCVAQSKSTSQFSTTEVAKLKM